MLRRLAVRDRVNLLALVPLLVIVVLHVPLIASRLDHARAASQTARQASVARQVRELIDAVQRTRLLSVSYLVSTRVSPNELVVQLERAQDERVRLAETPEIATRPELALAVAGAARMTVLGDETLTRQTAPVPLVEAYGRIVDGLVDALGLVGDTEADRTGAASLGALDALLRSDEAASRRTAFLLLAVLDPTERTDVVSESIELEVLEDVTADQFRRLAAREAVTLFQLADNGPAAERLTATESQLERDADLEVPPATAAMVFAAAQNQSEIRGLVGARIAQELAVAAAGELRTAWWTTAGLSVVGLSILTAVVALSIVVGRSVSRPLRQLTGAAGIVADLAQEELLRVADEDAQDVRVPRLAAIDVRSDDEIGDLAAAFNRVQATAALLLERQVVSRRNVASMFASLGRRTSNLVGRQLAIIDRLERAEEDPDTLASLFRLDHAATRLRRTASSLVVLSGGTESFGEGQPMPVGDVVRAALGTVEEYQRVSLRRMPKLWVSPGAVGDLALLLAELLDNAVSFSPPRTQVEVIGTMSRDGSCTLSIIDHGMGMPAVRLAQENSRLRRRERLDLAPSDVLGLFVVGRIARRHGIDVRLEETPPVGVTAVVSLPASLMVDGRAVSPAAHGAAATRHRQAAAEAGATARRLAERVGGRPAAQVDRERGTPPSRRTPAAAGTAPAASPAGPPTERRPSTEPSTERAPSIAPSGGGATGWPSEPRADAQPAPRPVPTAGASQTSTDEHALPRRVRGTNWTGDRVTPDAAPEDAGRVAAAAPPPPPGGEGLARRVPGSHLAGLDVGLATDGGSPTTAGKVDPEAVRSQVLDVEGAVDRARVVAEQGGPVPPPPPAAEIAARAGLTRRVPGAALDSFDGVGHGATAAAGERAHAGPGPDADRTRADLDAVDDALVRARQVRVPASGSVTAERRAAQASARARRAAEGRHTAQQQAVEDLRDGLVTGSLPLPGAAVATPPEPAPPPEPPQPLVRRVPGASLALFSAPDSAGARDRRAARQVNGAQPDGNGPDGNGPDGNGPDGNGPATRPIFVPERPDDVRAWAEDLESALARAPGSGPEGDPEPAATAGPDEQAATEGSET